MAELDPHESDGEFASAESDSESPEKVRQHPHPRTQKASFTLQNITGGNS